MSCSAGTEIVNDGLVFHYDMGNDVKCWKGKPTVNMSAGRMPGGNGNFTVDETIQDVLPDGTVGPVRYLNADYVYDANRTVSSGSYSVIAGETYTLSFYVKNIDCSGFGGNLYTPSLSRVIGGIYYPTIYTDKWIRVVTTFTMPDEGINPVSFSPQLFRDGGYGYFKMCWIQLELGSFATPYVNGTRSNTEAILDLTKNNTITANSLTYNSDGSFEFDGVDDIMMIEDPGLPQYDWSIEILTAYNDVSNSPMIVCPNSWGIDQFLRFGTTGQLSIIIAEQADTNQRTRSSGYLASAGEMVHYVFTRTSSKVYCYVNGELSNEYDDTDISQAWSGEWSVGARHNSTYWYKGEIPILKAYNKILSPEEVKQNFNALKNRYGI